MRRQFAYALVLSLSVTVMTLPADEPLELNVPHGLQTKYVRTPKDNPLTKGKVELGKQLYFDTRLSRDNTISCASCHDPQLGWSNGERFATGVDGQVGGRSAPTIINSAYLNAGSPRFTKVLGLFEPNLIALFRSPISCCLLPLTFQISARVR